MKTALIGFSIFSVIVLLVMLGFFSKYNYVTAKLAIKQKELVKVLINMHPMHAKNEIRVGKKYGLKVVNIRYKYGVKPIYYCGISKYCCYDLELPMGYRIPVHTRDTVCQVQLL